MNSRPILTAAERSQLEGDRAERTFDLWRSWAAEYTRDEEHEVALRGIERALSNGGGPTTHCDLLGTNEKVAGKQSYGPLTFASRVLVAMVAASVVGAIAWGLIFLLGRVIVRAVYG